MFNERTITNKFLFLKVLETVRRKGYAIDCAEEIEGVHCIGSPILNIHGYPVAAIWITGPSSRVREKDFDEIGEIVKKHAMHISKILGYNGS